MPGPLTYDKNAYADFLSYFEQVASNLVAVNHSEAHPAYIRMNTLEVLEQEQKFNAEYVLVVEPPDYRLINNVNQNILKEWQGAFMILKEVAEGDVVAEKAAQSECSLLVDQVMAKMHKDRRKRHLLDVTFDGMRGYPVSKALGSRAGWMQTIQFKSTAFGAMTPEMWQNEDMGDAPVPFATVIDGGQTINLQMFGSHTCTIPQPGTVTVTNSDESYSATVTAPTGQDTPHQLPDVEHTDSNGDSVPLPAMTPMVCTLAQPVTIRSSDGEDGPILYEQQEPAGGVHTLPVATVKLRDGSENDREYRPGATSYIHEEAPNAHVHVVNTDASYDEDVNPDNGPHELPDVRLDIRDSQGASLAVAYVPSCTTDRFEALPDVTHTQSNGSPEVLPMGTPMVCTPAAAATVQSASTSPLYTQSIASGGVEVLPQVRITDRFGVTFSREYRPAATSALWTETSIDVYEFLPSTNLLCAIGTKQMIAAWAGNLFRFRKATGGTEFNVGYTTNGYPDVTTAQTNLGADAGFVVRVYDQGGNSRDGFWTLSTAPQPRLGMAAGASSKQVQVAHILNQYLQCDCPITAGQTNTLYMACTPVEMAGAWMLCGGTGSSFKWWMNTDSLNRVYMYDGVSQNPVTSSYSVNQGAPMVIAIQFKTNSLRVYVNGTLVLSHNTWSVLASSMFQIARRVDGGGSIGQFNWNGIALYAADYDATIMTKMCNMFLR